MFDGVQDRADVPDGHMEKGCDFRSGVGAPFEAHFAIAAIGHSDQWPRIM